MPAPRAYSLTTVSEAHTGSIVTAGPSTGTFGGPGGGQGGGLGGLLDSSSPGTEVVTALSADADSFTWVAAAVGSQNAAGLQLATELPVMSIGGFNGSDPSPSLAQFQQDVADGRIHYFAADGGGAPGGGLGGCGTAQQITQWVEANVTQVAIGGSTSYDLTQPLGRE